MEKLKMVLGGLEPKNLKLKRHDFVCLHIARTDIPSVLGSKLFTIHMSFFYDSVFLSLETTGKKILG